MAADNCWGRESPSWLRMWPLLGSPSPRDGQTPMHICPLLTGLTGSCQKSHEVKKKCDEGIWGGKRENMELDMIVVDCIHV